MTTSPSKLCSVVSETLFGLFAFGVLLAADVLATPLAWNTNAAGNFIGSQTWTYDNAGVLATTDNPFTYPDPVSGSGANLVIIGVGGSVTLDTPGQGPFSNNALLEIRVGASAAEANFSGLIPPGPDLRGNGTLTVSNVDLLLRDDGSTTDQTGRLIIGGAANRTGVVNWNSTGTLRAHGHLRVGQGGTGTLNQNGGTIRTGVRSGIDGLMQVGNGGGTGTFNLNSGLMQLGDDDEDFDDVPTGIPVQQELQVAQGGGSVGTFNVGDGLVGAATFDTWGSVSVGMGGGTGVLNLVSDGVFRVNYPAAGGTSAQLRLGRNGGTAHGTVNQTGGTLRVDGLLELGFNTGAGVYNLIGSTGSSYVRSISANDASTFAFTLDAGGATTVNVFGNAADPDPVNPPHFGSADFASGNSISLGNTTLTVNGLSNYTSSSPFTLFSQLDPTASLNGTFGNYLQGQAVGLNGATTPQQFYLNYFGGDGNDIVLQSSVPASSTDGLVWNVGAANFDAGWAAGNGNFGAAPPGSGVDPFAGVQNLYLAKNGVANYNAATNDASGSQVKNLYIGTNRSAGIIGGTSGNGTLTVNDAENLTVVSLVDTSQGNAFIGEKGFTGTVNWNSSGTFDVQGQFRLGNSGGTGVVNQTAGVVQGGKSDGAGKYLSVGEGAGSTGTYNLKGGQFLPDGLGAHTVLRQLRVGYDGGTGAINVGDGVGAAESAVLQSEDDVNIGQLGGIGTMTVESDGLVDLVVNGAPLQVGLGGGNGKVVQNGGIVRSAGVITIGEGAGSVGEYVLNGGSLAGATDGTDAFRVGGGSGNGTLRVKNNATLTTQANFVIAQGGVNATSVGLLEITGSNATVELAKLENQNGVNHNETIRWVADAAGVTPIVVNGFTETTTQEVDAQLQNATENTANVGVNGGPNFSDLVGNGTALSLDLSALIGNQSHTLIDNQTADPIFGFFEDGTTTNLFEEGESIAGTGYNGTVSISYLGGTGNDVVLNLTAGAVNDADFDNDGDVDGSDFLTWQRGLGINAGATPSQGDANADGAVNGADLGIWKGQFGPAAETAVAAVPEPGAMALGMTAFCIVAAVVRRRSRD
ncbi:MAG: hypothetical protein H0T51_04555 [Pirellulales bacterium]|nr:hypothetical protein [Pirellulales bacterium]